MQDKCLVCSSTDYEIIQKNYQGYVEGSFFNIYRCNNCDTHFIITTDDLEKIYNTIYSHPNTIGYDRYYLYATSIKNKRNPLKFLANKEPTYYPIYNFVNKKSHLKILEIGCGYGYLSYALTKRGFDVKGLDIAKEAINFAKENFGSFFYNLDVKDFADQTNEKFDLIIATEVIEHLKDPHDFIKSCAALLKKEGDIILTTPDRDFSRNEAVWQTDLPPVHIFWVGRKGIKILAENNGFKVSFQDFSKYYPKYENRLVKFFVSRTDALRNPALSIEGNPIKMTKPSSPYRFISFFVHKVPFIRYPSNFVYNLINGKESTLGIFLRKY